MVAVGTDQGSATGCEPRGARPHRQEPEDTRFTGGWAFLLSVALTAALGWAG